jgi:hypothetical protein
MDVVIGMTLAPRENETVNKSIKSMRDAGVQNLIYLYCEPGEYDISDKNVEVKMNNEQLGCFKNFDNMVKDLLSMGSKYIFVTQDDYLYEPRMWEEAEDIVK